MRYRVKRFNKRSAERTLARELTYIPGEKLVGGIALAILPPVILTALQNRELTVFGVVYCVVLLTYLAYLIDRWVIIRPNEKKELRIWMPDDGTVHFEEPKE